MVKSKRELCRGKICGLGESEKGAFVSQDSGGSWNKKQPGIVKVNTERFIESAVLLSG